MIDWLRQLKVMFENARDAHEMSLRFDEVQISQDAHNKIICELLCGGQVVYRFAEQDQPAPGNVLSLRGIEGHISITLRDY